MAGLDEFVEHILGKIGAEGREQVRQSWDIIAKIDPEIQVKLYASFLWATWLRGKGGPLSGGREDFWGRV